MKFYLIALAAFVLLVAESSANYNKFFCKFDAGHLDFAGKPRHCDKLSFAYDIDTWLPKAGSSAYSKLLANILDDGAVAASPSGQSRSDFPDYWYHWVRDAALTMDTLRKKWIKAVRGSAEKANLEKLLWKYVDHESRLQSIRTKTGLGEPKFQIDGNAFNEPWGRPQNDGAALRASVLIRFATQYIREGGSIDTVRTRLYDGRLPSNTVIKRDLEYVASVIGQPSFDLWEEVLGTNFFTQVVQEKALREGAKFARLLGDFGAATYYGAAALAVKANIDAHFDRSAGVVYETLNRVGGIDWKSSNTDIAAVLAAVYTFQETDNPQASLISDPIIGTHLAKIADKFYNVFPVNKLTFDGSVAPGIGRYPEDRYSGTPNDGQGNPWFLATNVAAEYYYVSGDILCRLGGSRFEKPSQQSKLHHLPKFLFRGLKDQSYPLSTSLEVYLALGDKFLRRTAIHQGSDYEMAEQFDKNDGFQKSARDLTWSYASLLRADMARNSLKECLSKRESGRGISRARFDSNL